MIIIIIGLVVLLVIGVVVVNGMQQHKAKQEQEKRAKSAKFKAIIEESDALIDTLQLLPPSPALITILNNRSLSAAKSMLQLSPSNKIMKQKVEQLETDLKNTKNPNQANDDNFSLPDDEKQLVGMLQAIKKLRAMLKSEKSKGMIDAQMYSQQDLRLDSIQLKIGVESVVSRGKKAQSKDMLGSARQYFEKAIQTLSSHPHQSDYTKNRRAEIEEQLNEITTSLKVTNAEDVAKKAKDEEDDLDLLFQPKKKW